MNNKEKTKRYFAQGKLLFTEGKLEEALEQYSRCLALNCNHIPALRQLAKIHEVREEYDRAIEYRQRLLKLQPNSFAYRALAALQEKQGNMDRAIVTYREALQIIDPLDPSWSDLARLCMDLYHRKAKSLIAEELMNREKLLSFSSLDRTNLNPKNEIKTILFCLSFLVARKVSPHVKTVLDYAYYLTKLNPNINFYIFITNERYIAEDWRVRQPKKLKDTPTRPLLADFKSHYDLLLSFYKDASQEKIIFISGSNLGIQNPTYGIEVLDRIFEINPDVVLFLGGNLDSVILPDVLYLKYPTMYMQFNLNNQPKFNFDIYIANGNPTNFDRFINPKRWRKHRRPIMPFPKHEKYDYTRVKSSSEYKTIITAGVGLENRIKDDCYIDRMATILNTHTNVCWLVVGVKDVDEFLQRSHSLEHQYQQGKVKFIEFDPDLRALYELCDIYAYPRHGGGGNGNRLAAVEGLPILCYTSNDAEAHFQGTPVKFHESDDEYFQYLEHLILDEAFRKAEGEKVKSFAPHPDHVKACIDDFLDLCQEARESFYRRTNIATDEL